MTNFEVVRCSKCGIEMRGMYDVHVKGTSFESLSQVMICTGDGKKGVRAYTCPKCGKVEFYIGNSK